MCMKIMVFDTDILFCQKLVLCSIRETFRITEYFLQSKNKEMGNALSINYRKQGYIKFIPSMLLLQAIKLSYRDI